MFVSRHMSLARAGAIATAALALLSAPRRADAQQRYSDNALHASFDTTFALDKDAIVSLNSTNGNIVVSGWSENRVHVHVTSERRTVRMEASANRLDLEQSSGGDDDDVRYDVTVPFGVRVLARARSGDVSVRGTRGEVEANSQSGDVRVADVIGHLDVSTFSGDVTAESIHAVTRVNAINGDVTVHGLNGDAEITTVSGDVSISDGVSRNLRLQSTSGDLSYDGTIDSAGRYDLTTHSGDVELRIPRATSAQLTVSTWSGDIDSAFPIVLQPGEHSIGVASAKHFTFDIGRGESRIDAETFSGDITIRSTGGGRDQ